MQQGLSMLLCPAHIVSCPRAQPAVDPLEPVKRYEHLTGWAFSGGKHPADFCSVSLLFFAEAADMLVERYECMATPETLAVSQGFLYCGGIHIGRFKGEVHAFCFGVRANFGSVDRSGSAAHCQRLA